MMSAVAEGARADMESAPTGCGAYIYIPWILAATEAVTGRRGRRPLRSRGGFLIRLGCLQWRKVDAERLPVYSAGL